MPKKDKDKISFSDRRKSSINIRPKPAIKEKFERESIHIQEKPPLAESVTKLWNTATFKVVGGLLLFTIIGVIVILYTTPETPIVSSPNSGDNPWELIKKLQEKQQRIPDDSLPFVVERRILQLDMLDAMIKDTTQLPFSWEVMSELEEILSWSIGLRNIKKQDTIYCVWERDQSGQKKNEIAALALQVNVLDTALFAILYPYNGEADYYDYEGRPLRRKFLKSPVRYGKVSSRYNLTRMHPILYKIKAHEGTDFAAPEGDPIYALAGGEIIRQAFHPQGNGKFVEVLHDSIYRTTYLHMSRFPIGQKLGDQVEQGDIIGYVGSTGQSSGPHVCLRFWQRDIQRDFVHEHPFLQVPRTLPYQTRQHFIARRDSIITAIGLFND